jgi:hypothetical protein
MFMHQYINEHRQHYTTALWLFYTKLSMMSVFISCNQSGSSVAQLETLFD